MAKRSPPWWAISPTIGEVMKNPMRISQLIMPDRDWRHRAAQCLEKACSTAARHPLVTTPDIPATALTEIRAVGVRVHIADVDHPRE